MQQRCRLEVKFSKIWENIEEALNSLPDLGSQNLQ